MTLFRGSFSGVFGQLVRQSDLVSREAVPASTPTGGSNPAVTPL